MTASHDHSPASPPFAGQVLALVRRIPPGAVMSYGDVAAYLGKPRAARGVGWVLSALPPDTGVPWWRVVNREGRISAPTLHHTAARQRALLDSEGVVFDPAGRIDRERFGWWPPAVEVGEE